MKRSRRLWPALLPLLLVLGVAAATCGSAGSVGLGGTALAGARGKAGTDGVRGAEAIGRVSTNSFRKQLTSQYFDGGRATTHVTPTFDGLGMVTVNRHGVLYAIQRRGASSIDPTGEIAVYEFRGAEQGWVTRSIYNSKWDDRNVAGGVTPKGTLVVFFARYDAATGHWIDLGYMRSTDDGHSFSDYKTIPTGPDRWFSPYGPLVVLPSGRLMMLVYGNNGYTYRVRAIFSDDDGETWGDESVIDEQSFERPTEAAGVLVSGTRDANARLLVVARSEPGPHPDAKGGLYQYTSRDGGRTWRRDGYINVSETPTDVCPWIVRVSDDRLALVWAARRSMTIEVSITESDRVFANRRRWRKPYTLYTSRLANQRPRQAANFGYPAIAHMGTSDNDAVVVFFDANAADPSIFHEKVQANTDLVLIRLLGPRIAEERRLARSNGSASS